MNRSLAILAVLFAAATPSFAQDAEAGKSVFGQCRACHAVGEVKRKNDGGHGCGVLKPWHRTLTPSPSPMQYMEERSKCKISGRRTNNELT